MLGYVKRDMSGIVDQLTIETLKQKLKSTLIWSLNEDNIDFSSLKKSAINQGKKNLGLYETDNYFIKISDTYNEDLMINLKTAYKENENVKRHLGMPLKIYEINNAYAYVYNKYNNIDKEKFETLYKDYDEIIELFDYLYNTHKIYYFDINRGNFMLNKDNDVVLIDFDNAMIGDIHKDSMSKIANILGIESVAKKIGIDTQQPNGHHTKNLCFWGKNNIEKFQIHTNDKVSFVSLLIDLADIKYLEPIDTHIVKLTQQENDNLVEKKCKIVNDSCIDDKKIEDIEHIKKDIDKLCKEEMKQIQQIEIGNCFTEDIYAIDEKIKNVEYILKQILSDTLQEKQIDIHKNSISYIKDITKNDEIDMREENSIKASQDINIEKIKTIIDYTCPSKKKQRIIYNKGNVESVLQLLKDYKEYIIEYKNKMCEKNEEYKKKNKTYCEEKEEQDEDDIVLRF